MKSLVEEDDKGPSTLLCHFLTKDVAPLGLYRQVLGKDNFAPQQRQPYVNSKVDTSHLLLID